jgi:hypothetical protein
MINLPAVAASAKAPIMNIEQRMLNFELLSLLPFEIPCLIFCGLLFVTFGNG